MILLPDKKIEFSFNASGWNQIFQMGVVYFFQRHIELKSEQFAAVGTSAGATTAAILAMGVPADVTGEKACVQEVLIKKDFKSMVQVMQKAVRDMTPENAAEYLKSDCFGIVCSELTNCCKLSTIEFREFKDRKDVVELLCATCHIPIFSGYWPYWYDGKYLYDGLFTTTHPREPGSIENNDKTMIYISWTPRCVCGCTKPPNNTLTIAPSVEMPLRWCMLPQNKENLRLIFYHGYCQAYRKFFEEATLRNLFTLKGKSLQPVVDIRGIDLNLGEDNANKAALNILKTTPIDEPSTDRWNLVLNHSDAIADYISNQVIESNREWSGICGCIKYFCMFLRIFFPCLPIVCCARSCLREEGRFHVEERKTKVQ